MRGAGGGGALGLTDRAAASISCTGGERGWGIRELGVSRPRRVVCPGSRVTGGHWAIQCVLGASLGPLGNLIQAWAPMVGSKDPTLLFAQEASVVFLITGATRLREDLSLFIILAPVGHLAGWGHTEEVQPHPTHSGTQRGGGSPLPCCSGPPPPHPKAILPQGSSKRPSLAPIPSCPMGSLSSAHPETMTFQQGNRAEARGGF